MLPALIRKCHEAKVSGACEIRLSGTGSPRRKFLHSDDMEETCAFLMELPDDVFDSNQLGSPGFQFINVGSEKGQSFAELKVMSAK